MKNISLITLIITLLNNVAFANEPQLSSENLWTSGKIYVVLAVVLIILLGIIFFLVHLENRIRKLEK